MKQIFNIKGKYSWWKFRISILIPYWYSLFIGRTYWTVKVSDKEIKLYFNTLYHHAMAREQAKGVFESNILSLWSELEGTVIYDIGGYNGIYGLISAKSNPNAHVTIFEPDPINAFHIRKNIEINGLSEKVVCSQCAITDHIGFVFISDESKGRQHITEKGIKVPATILAALPEADLIKIDVEGAEGLVLSTLSYKPTIMLERHSRSLLAQYNTTNESLMEKLTGFSISIISENGNISNDIDYQTYLLIKPNLL